MMEIIGFNICIPKRIACDWILWRLKGFARPILYTAICAFNLGFYLSVLKYMFNLTLHFKSDVNQRDLRVTKQKTKCIVYWVDDEHIGIKWMV